MVGGREYVAVREVAQKDALGNTVFVEKQKRIKQWFYTNNGKNWFLEVRYGNKALELAEGKTAIAIQSKDKIVRTIEKIIEAVIAKELDVDPETTFEENREFAEKFIKRRNEIMNDIRLGLSPTFNFATGGRVGYQLGNSVMPGQPMQAQAAGPTDQGPAPEDMAGITYEELRARLPQEVSDDIVRLLANSAEALEDFAMIQTEQDINTFNKKYGVTLVLPSEG